MLALSQDVQQNRPVEAREHIRRFHELFFTLSPDKSAIESNIQRALFLSDESAIGYYRNLQEKGYFNRMIAGNISQTLTVDSIQGNFNSYPYEMKTSIGSPYKASVHTHPIELIALSHNKKFMEKDVATNLLWSMIPETKAFCPRGLGMIPYQLPSSVELADATIKELADYDVVMWEKHGIFAVDRDVMAAFDQIDVLNKSALIYIAAKNMGFEPDGMSQEQMKEMSVAFNLPK